MNTSTCSLHSCRALLSPLSTNSQSNFLKELFRNGITFSNTYMEAKVILEWLKNKVGSKKTESEMIHNSYASQPLPKFGQASQPLRPHLLLPPPCISSCRPCLGPVEAKEGKGPGITLARPQPAVPVLIFCCKLCSSQGTLTPAVSLHSIPVILEIPDGVLMTSCPFGSPS